MNQINPQYRIRPGCTELCRDIYVNFQTICTCAKAESLKGQTDEKLYFKLMNI